MARGSQSNPLSDKLESRLNSDINPPGAVFLTSEVSATPAYDGAYVQTRVEIPGTEDFMPSFSRADNYTEVVSSKVVNW